MRAAGLGLGADPVGATGVRMLLDAATQVNGRANGCHADPARKKNRRRLNIGGELRDRRASFVVARDEPSSVTTS